MYTINPNQEQKMLITGPAGQLEAMVSDLLEKDKRNIGIICHPHPLYQGTMNNKVVTTITRAWQSLGLATVRFNFRGVGASEGHYDEGRGEVLDLEAIVAFVNAQQPDAKIWLAGFSFGSFITLQVATRLKIAGLISVAPALPFFDFLNVAKPSCPWLVIQGDQDELVPSERVSHWFEFLNKQKESNLYWKFVCLPRASHFFHGHLRELTLQIEGFMSKVLIG